MRQLAFTADDFGLSEVANHAMIRAHREGALTGVSLMLGQAGTAHAIELARAHPALQVGWHIHLCDSRPLTCARWPWGNSPLPAGLALGVTREHRRFLAGELAAQWRAFQSSGLRCSFVNGHHHLHVHPTVLRELAELLPVGFDGWLRGLGVRLFAGPAPWHARFSWLAAPLARRALARSGFRVSSTVWGIDRLFAMQADEVLAAVKKLPLGLHEFVFHPRRSEGDADVEALLELRRLWPTALPLPQTPA